MCCFTGAIGFVGISPHMNEVDYSPEVMFASNRHLNRHGGAAERLCYAGNGLVKIGPLAIHFRYDDESRNIKLVGITPCLFRLHFNAADRVNHHKRRVRGTQGSLRVKYECGKPRCVEYVDLYSIPLAICERAYDAQLPGYLIFIIVSDGSSVVYTA